MRRHLSCLAPARSRTAFLMLALVGGPVAVAFAQSSAEKRIWDLKRWLGADPFEMWAQNDLIGQFCMAALVIFSVGSWGVILQKIRHLRRAERQTEAFVAACSGGSGRLEEAFAASADYPDSPLAQILREAYLELEMENWYREGYELDDAGRLDLAKSSIERVFERAITNEISALERWMNFLATTISVCPFIGLFGTVWGIMVAFQAFTGESSVSIAALAPGISTALLTTVGGLFCAIPASVMYNNFTTRMRDLASRMDSFALELGNIIQKQIAKGMHRGANMM